MKRNIIIDCDPGIDDSLAIMLALSCEEIEVLGITITCGNTPAEMGFENTKKILKHMNRLDIPIYIGAHKPLKKPYVNALDTHGPDGLGGSFLDAVSGYDQSLSAVEFLSQTLRKQSCSIVAIGPLTNLAQLIHQDPKAFENIGMLISMGGNYRSHGNCSPVAEYNYWEDPEAAAIVYAEMARLGRHIHMVGLDVTRQIILTPELLSYMEMLDPIQGSFVRQITRFYFEFHWQWERLIGCVINDPLAIAYFLYPQLCEGFHSYVQIETESISRGQSIVDAHHFYRQEANAFVLTKVDVLGFFTLFYQKLLRKDKNELTQLNQLLNIKQKEREGEKK